VNTTLTNRHVSACRDGDVHMYDAPGVYTHQYNPFAMRHIYRLSPDRLYCACWSGDSRCACGALCRRHCVCAYRLLAVGGEDSITRIVCGDRMYANLYAQTLGGHTVAIRAVFFALTDAYHVRVCAQPRLHAWALAFRSTQSTDVACSCIGQRISMHHNWLKDGLQNK
jgi:hypothetical protein